MPMECRNKEKSPIRGGLLRQFVAFKPYFDLGTALRAATHNPFISHRRTHGRNLKISTVRGMPESTSTARASGSWPQTSTGRSSTIRGQPVMGARCFKGGAPRLRGPYAAHGEAQAPARTRQEREMERMFAPAIAPTDPDFFVRRRMSYKLMRDDIAADPAAAAWQGASRRLSHARAHLDVDLMESDTPRDPRLIFWAVANHVVRRGHFLMEGHDVTSANSDPSAQVETLVRELDALGEACGEDIELDDGALADMGAAPGRPVSSRRPYRAPCR